MRPRFLDQPYFSTRAPRVDQTAAEYADPLDFPAERKSSWSWIDWATIALVAVVAIGIWRDWL
jgi:hypothetical protein